MFPTTHTEELKWIHYPARKSRKRLLTDCISIAAIEDSYIINKDGSIAVGFEVSLIEEELLDEDGFSTIIQEFSSACRKLPIGTLVQKLDIYDHQSFQIDIPNDLPFFHRKTLEHHH
jgi:hypothetical protein